MIYFTQCDENLGPYKYTKVDAGMIAKIDNI